MLNSRIAWFIYGGLFMPLILSMIISNTPLGGLAKAYDNFVLGSKCTFREWSK